MTEKLEAFKVCQEKLSGLNGEDRENVIRTLCVFFGVLEYEMSLILKK